eukprot:TRINITY_DN12019_c1_g6_i14.p2 TRINITY_DN12019_c1_g6~~TRINITY_DN12019_c1_g6_i14.p2  ORF type:complete len:314 (+),score=38.43 TRINITY_DN12019_c1_g6_i14:174-1115(+)
MMVCTTWLRPMATKAILSKYAYVGLPNLVRITLSAPLLQTSTNLVNWTLRGTVFNISRPGYPVWAVDKFWAPEIHKVNESLYNCYYAAEHVDGTLSVGLAQASQPLGPYIDYGIPIVHTPGMGNIDASFFQDTDGIQYLLWKQDANGHMPQQATPVFIASATHNATTIDDPKILLINDQLWEGSLIEGPWMIRHKDYYYLFYSANGFTSPNYAIGVARSKAVTGPFEKLDTSRNPIVERNTDETDLFFNGPGHCSVVQTRNGNWVIAYHAWYKNDIAQGHPRMMLIDVLTFGDDDWPVVRNRQPSTTPQPIPQ